MQFQVPQFIEVEDKIFGPLTFKQFAYLIGGAASCFLVFSYVRHISTILAIILMVPVGGAFLALAFQKVNGRPMIIYVEAGLKYLLGNKLYLWKKSTVTKDQAPEKIVKTASPTNIPKLSESKLKDLSWSLDIEKND